MSTFKLDISKYAEKTKRGFDEVVREIVVSVGALVVMRSPVGKRELWASNIDRASRGLEPLPAGYAGGHFRANNQYGFGTVPTNEVAGEDPTGSVAMAAIQSGVKRTPAAGVHYIANNVPYAMALENGHSMQAPQGIYGLSAIDVATEARRIIAEKTS